MNIALLGYGTVGSGVYELVHKNKNNILNKFDKSINISKILVRNLDKYRELEHFDLFTDQFEDVKSESPDLVIEVMGGLNPSYTYINHFLSSGIDVITANKDLIAEHGAELMATAKANNALLSFEASVAGGIPILKTLQESLGGNEINAVSGIINGTTNFILTKMYDEDLSYEEALSLAQEKGFAEADPSSDVHGYDAIRKLAIISSLAYDKNVNWSELPTEGITEIDSKDIWIAKSINTKIKLVAFSEFYGNTLYGTVRPVLVPDDSPFGKIDNEFNAVSLDGDAVGNVMFFGKGAGKFPTASAILGDLLDIVQNKKQHPNRTFSSDVELVKTWPNKSKWMIRVICNETIEITTSLFEIFSENSIELHHHEDREIVAIVEEVNEDTLIKKMNLLFSNPHITKIKHFLIFE